MKKIMLTMSTLATFALIGCGGGGGGSSSNNSGTNPDGTAKDPFKIQKVEYTLNGSNIPTCNNASQITTSKARTNNDIGLQQCVWLCGDYEGARPISVVLTFIQHNGGNSVWQFDSDTVTTPSQQCHN